MSAIKSIPSESISGAEIESPLTPFKPNNILLGDKNIARKMAEAIVQKKIVWGVCNKKSPKNFEETAIPLISCFPINTSEITLPKKLSLFFKSEKPITIKSNMDVNVDENNVVLNGIVVNNVEDENLLNTTSMAIPIFPITIGVGKKSVGDNLEINHMVNFSGKNSPSNIPNDQNKNGKPIPIKQSKYTGITINSVLKDKQVIEKNALHVMLSKNLSENKPITQPANLFSHDVAPLDSLRKKSSKLINDYSNTNINNDFLSKIPLTENSSHEQNLDILNKASSLLFEAKNNEFPTNKLVDVLKEKSSVLIDSQSISTVEEVANPLSGEEQRIQNLPEGESLELTALPKNSVMQSITDVLIRPQALPQMKEPAPKNYKQVALVETREASGVGIEKKSAARSLTYAFNSWQNEPSVTFELATKGELIASTYSHEVQHALHENKHLFDGEHSVYIRREENRDEQRNQQQHQQEED